MLILILIITTGVSIVCTYSWNFLLSGNSFKTEKSFYLTGSDNDLEECWHMIRNKTDTTGYPAVLFNFWLDRAADGEIKSFSLDYFIQKEDGWDTYSTSYHENKDKPGGKFSVKFYRTKPEVPGYATRYPLDPGEFLRDVDMINLTDLGYNDSILSVYSDNMYGNLEYTYRADDEIFLQDGDQLLPLESIALQEDCPAFAVYISEMECSDYYGNVSCSSSETTVVFSNERLRGAEVRLMNETGACS
ncbi:hypothetical protein Mpet_0654 [Methanolacinia petrolearia DSM 11571]|uniref:Uncharacterized protein n=1 Tax=Methanolacinia petrolearia (strain DSM 11571 / OCM 486 / SEBR 4847) TaxID=679926 RepID=E1RI43_METP4|nr:hypothetical protein Mpet_0654 [Methanolacinia petrolearia DSM 11571]